MNNTYNSSIDLSTQASGVRPVILVFNAFYLPGYRGGGPIRTIANMVDRLSDDFDFRIVTMDRDLHDAQPYQSVNLDAWNTIGKAQVFYASPLTRTLRGTIQLLRETRYDLLYLNSFFDAAFTLRPLLVRRLRLVPNRPTVLAPRGEFSAGAFKIKLWKKAPFARLAHFFKLYAGITWHASTELEVADIQRVMGESEADIKVARNVAIAPDILADCAASAIIDDKVARGDKALSVCFLSRISPKKNLDFALKVLACVKAPVQFTIYGPLEQPAYWKMCQELIKNMPKHIAVSYGGSVQHDRVRSTLAKFDIFFLPTLGENFGHVFLEAWSAGVSVLISDQTPWRGLEKQQLGWDIPLQNPEEFVLALETAAKLSHRQRSQARTRCAQFARSKAEDPEALDLNRRLFWHALAADSPKPLR